MSAVTHSAAWKMQPGDQLLQGGESLQQRLNENLRSVDEEIIACRNKMGGFLSDLDERYVGRQCRRSTVCQMAVCFVCFY